MKKNYCSLKGKMKSNNKICTVYDGRGKTLNAECTIYFQLVSLVFDCG